MEGLRYTGQKRKINLGAADFPIRFIGPLAERSSSTWSQRAKKAENEKAGLEGRIKELEAELGESERRNTAHEMAFQKDRLEGRVTQLSSNETIRLAQLTLTKQELAKQQQANKAAAARAEAKAQELQREAAENLKVVQAEWRDRMKWQVAAEERLEAQNRWIWAELRAAQNWIRTREEMGDARFLPSPEPEYFDYDRSPGQQRGNESWVQTLERRLLRSTKIIRDLEAQAQNQDAILRYLREERDTLTEANEKLVAEAGVTRDREFASEKEKARLMESRRGQIDLNAHLKDQVKLLTAHNKDLTGDAERAKAEAERLRSFEARALSAEAEVEKFKARERMQQETSAASDRAKDRDAKETHPVSPGDGRRSADPPQSGTGREVKFPTGGATGQRRQAASGAQEAGTSKEPIDLNDDPVV